MSAGVLTPGLQESIGRLIKPPTNIQLPESMQLAAEVGKRQQAEIYAAFSMKLLNIAIDQIHELTQMEVGKIRALIMTIAELQLQAANKAKQEAESNA